MPEPPPGAHSAEQTQPRRPLPITFPSIARSRAGTSPPDRNCTAYGGTGIGSRYASPQPQPEQFSHSGPAVATAHPPSGVMNTAYRPRSAASAATGAASATSISAAIAYPSPFWLENNPRPGVTHPEYPSAQNMICALTQIRSQRRRRCRLDLNIDAVIFSVGRGRVRPGNPEVVDDRTGIADNALRNAGRERGRKPACLRLEPHVSIVRGERREHIAAGGQRRRAAVGD